MIYCSSAEGTYLDRSQTVFCYYFLSLPFHLIDAGGHSFFSFLFLPLNHKLATIRESFALRYSRLRNERKKKKKINKDISESYLPRSCEIRGDEMSESGKSFGHCVGRAGLGVWRESLLCAITCHSVESGEEKKITRENTSRSFGVTFAALKMVSVWIWWDISATAYWLQKTHMLYWKSIYQPGL